MGAAVNSEKSSAQHLVSLMKVLGQATGLLAGIGLLTGYVYRILYLARFGVPSYLFEWPTYEYYLQASYPMTWIGAEGIAALLVFDSYSYLKGWRPKAARWFAIGAWILAFLCFLGSWRWSHLLAEPYYALMLGTWLWVSGGWLLICFRDGHFKLTRYAVIGVLFLIGFVITLREAANYQAERDMTVGVSSLPLVAVEFASDEGFQAGELRLLTCARGWCYMLSFAEFSQATPVVHGFAQSGIAHMELRLPRVIYYETPSNVGVPVGQ